MNESNKVFNVHNVPGDGNCFFHCLSFALHSNLTMSSTYRQTICNYILKNWEQFQHHIEIQKYSSLSYFQHMILGNGYATSLEIEVAALLLQQQINVWLECKNASGASHILTTFQPSSKSDNFPINLLLKDQHFQYLAPPVNDAQTSKSEINSSNHHAKTTKIVDIDFNSQKHSATVNKQTSTQIPDISYEHNSANDQQNTTSHTNNNEFQNQNATVNKQTSAQIPDISYEHNYANFQHDIYSHTNNNEFQNTSTQADISCVHNDANVQQNTSSHSNYNEFQNQNASFNKQASAQIMAISCEHNYVDREFQDENVPVHITDSKCNKKGTSCRKRHLAQNACASNVSTTGKKSKHTNFAPESEKKLQELCRKYGIQYEEPAENESYQKYKLRKSKLYRQIKCKIEKYKLNESEIPSPPPLSNNAKYDKAMDSIRAFELQQMSYFFQFCTICKERRLEMKMSKNSVCSRCFRDKHDIKLFSSSNNMDPGKLPEELQGLTIIEQQLISRLSPCINVHMLSHGGVASSGHCVTFPQEINEPAKIFPRLPQEIQIIKVKKQGKNDTCREFRVRRLKVEQALKWLKINNPAYVDIIISSDRLLHLPEDGELSDITTLQFKENTPHNNDKGPSSEQIDIGISEGYSHSGAQLPDSNVHVKENVEKIVQEILGENHGEVSINKRGTISIPWPTRGNIPVSEFTTQHFFTLAFPALFPHGSGDFYINRPISFSSMSEWAEHLLWYDDGRFAKHPYFKFVVHNMIMRKSALERSTYIIKQKLGDNHFTVADLLKMGTNQ